MANENGNKDNGNFFLGAIFAAVIFFLLFFMTRLRSAVGAFGAGANAASLAGGGAGTGTATGAPAGACVTVCDECNKPLAPYAYKAAPPAYVGGGFTEVAAEPIQTPMFNAIGQVINPFGNVTGG